MNDSETTNSESTNLEPLSTDPTISRPSDAEPSSSQPPAAPPPASAIPVTQPTPHRSRRPGVLGPLLLITLGVLFLLANLGYLDSTFWLSLIQFWPLLLILAGIEILLGRSRIGQLVVLLVSVVAIGGVIWFLINPNQLVPGGGLVATPISQPVENVQSADLELNLGVGELDLGALDTSSTDWILGTVSAPGNRQILVESESNSGVAALKISSEGGSTFFGNPSERWNLDLSPAIPINLSVDAGVGGSKLDLNALNIPQLDVNTGVGGLQVVMPAHAGTVSATLDGGVGGLTVLIPEGVPARIRTSTGVGGLSINQSRFPNIGEDLYSSPDYDTATNRIDLSVDSGVGGITIP